MKAMILAAGGATRLYPLTYSLPKPLIPVLNVPVIEHIIRLLVSHGFEDIVINLHNQAKMISGALGDGASLGAKIQYSIEEELQGTAGGIRLAQHLLRSEDPCLVIGGDTLTDLDLSSMMKFHREKKALATVAVRPLSDSKKNSEVGVLELDGDERVTWFLEKPGPGRGPAGRWASGGIYLFDPEFFQLIPSKGVVDLATEVFPELVRNRQSFFGFSMGSSYWCDVGTHLSYRQTHFELLDGKSKVRIPGRELKAHVWVGEDVKISPGCVIKAPALIGSGCVLEPGAEICGPVVLGPDTHVKSGARVRGSIVWEKSVIGHKTVVEDCLAGSGCRMLDHQRYSKMVLGSGARDEAQERHSHD